MKGILRKMTVAGVITYVVLGIFILSKVLIYMPLDIFNALGSKDNGQVAQISGALYSLLAWLILQFSVGMGVIVMLMRIKVNAGNADVVYVEKYVDKTKNKEQESFVINRAAQNEERIERTRTLIYQKNTLDEKYKSAIQKICNELEATIGTLFITKFRDEKRVIELVASYAYQIPDSQTVVYEYGEGISGQVAKQGKPIMISSVPEGYIKVLSGLGSATPTNLIAVPIKDKALVVKGVIEVASFRKFDELDLSYVESIAATLGEAISKNIS